MADISKCFGTGCPVKEKCYRYTARANEFRQSYVAYWKHLAVCDYFWDNKKQKKQWSKKEN